MTGVAGRATVLTEDAELLFGVTAGEAGGITAALTLLLAPLAPLAAPAAVKGVCFSHLPLQSESREVAHLALPGNRTFFGFHVLAIAVRKVILYSALLHGLSVVVVIVVIEP